MFDERAVKEAFGRAAPEYDLHSELQREVREQCITLAKSCWEDGDHILDAGSGTGALAEDVRRIGPGWGLTGLDVSAGMCRVAKENNHPAINADAGAMPFADGTFDGVFSSLMLQWANQPVQILREMARVTKEGGRAIVSTFVQGTLQELREAFAAMDTSPHVSPFLEPHQLSAIAVHAGFAVLSVDQETITEHYPNSVTLMRALKSIGATNKEKTRRRGMMTPRQLGRLEKEYRASYGDKHGLPATWQVMYMILEKR